MRSQLCFQELLWLGQALEGLRFEAFSVAGMTIRVVERLGIPLSLARDGCRRRR